MRWFGIAVAVLSCWAGFAAIAQATEYVYGNAAGCDVHFNRTANDTAEMVLLKDRQLMFYEIACKNLVVGNQSGRIETLTASCVDYEGTYDFTWNFFADGNDGFVLATPDQSFSTVLKICR